MTFNEYIIIARAAGIEIECEKDRIHGKHVYTYHLYNDGKHGQKFITVVNPDSQISYELENDLFKFMVKMQEQDK